MIADLLNDIRHEAKPCYQHNCRPCSCQRMHTQAGKCIMCLADEIESEHALMEDAIDKLRNPTA